MYKVGDLVVIKKREGDAYDYPLEYVDRMLQYEDKIAKIIEISDYKLRPIDKKKKIL